MKTCKRTGRRALAVTLSAAILTAPAVAHADGASPVAGTQELTGGASSVDEVVAEASTAMSEQRQMTLTMRDRRFALPADGNAAAYVWQSSDTSVASVDEAGLIKPQKTGVTTITGTPVENLDAPSVHVAVTVVDFNYNTDYNLMKDRWIRRIAGTAPADPALNASDSSVKIYAAQLIKQGHSAWDTMIKEPNRTSLWKPDESKSPAANLTLQVKNLRKLAVAFGLNIDGNDLYQNPRLLEDIVSGVECLVKQGYNGVLGKDGWDNDRWGVGTNNNWWDWQIGVAPNLNDVLMIISDYVDYERIKPAVEAIEGYIPDPSHQLVREARDTQDGAQDGWVVSTGANRTDLGLAVLGSAMLAHDDARIQTVREQVPEVMQFVTSGDGLYADGSVVQHTAQPYTGSYGNELVKGIGKIASILGDTSFAFPSENMDNLYRVISDGYIPLIRDANMMSMVCGRSISRLEGSLSAEVHWGKNTIANVLMIAQSAPEPYRTEFMGVAKGWLAQMGDAYFTGPRDFDALLQGRELEADARVVPTTYTGMHVYGSMDRVVQANGSYAAGLSMYSNRIYNYEAMNAENLRGWHTGDGMLYVYTDGAESEDPGFWPTVDPYRLPGTTSDTRELPEIPDNEGTPMLSDESWVGGVTDGTNGAAGMALDASTLDFGMDLTAKKSYFFLNGQIVALGAGVTGTSPASIETTVENRILEDAERAVVAVDGKPINFAATDSLSLKTGQHVTLDTGDASSSMGYYMLQDETLAVSRETRTGSYKDINSKQADKKFTRTYLKLGIDHGQAPDQDTYAYGIVPAASDAQVADAATSVEVLDNTANIQAIRQADAGVVAMNLWNAGSAAGIGADSAASLYTVRAGDTMTVSVSDPTQMQTAVRVRIDGAKGLIGAAEGVTDNGDGTFTVDVNGDAGASHTFKVSMTQVPGGGGESGNEETGGSNRPQTPDGQQSDAQTDGALPQTGDSTLWTTLVASLGGISALVAGAVVRRHK